MDRSSFGESLGHAESGVSGKSAYLKDKLRPYHGHQHLEQTALNMARCHTRVEQPEVGLTVQFLEESAFRCYVRRDILFQEVFTRITDTLSRCSHNLLSLCKVNRFF